MISKSNTFLNSYRVDGGGGRKEGTGEGKRPTKYDTVQCLGMDFKWGGINYVIPWN